MIDWFTEFADALVPLFGIVAFFRHADSDNDVVLSVFEPP